MKVFIQSRRKFFILRVTALFLVGTLLFEIIFPTAAYALSSGPTSPDVYGNQPVDATDNVSLVTGDFNYTVPITSIPEYPMALGYASTGLSMDQDAGVFGFGVNSFTGAIARNVQGLPDDLYGGPRRYKTDNQKQWDASVTGSFSGGFPATDLGISGVGSVSLTVGYNNYTGMYGALGISLNLIPLETDYGTLAGGLSFNTSSKNGASANVGMSFGMFSFEANGENIHHMHGNLQVLRSTRHLLKHGKQELKDMVKAVWDIGISEYPAYTGNITSAYAPLAAVVATNSSFGVSTPGIPIGPVVVSGTFNIENPGNANDVKNSYGFMYLKNHDSRQRTQISDMTIEGEVSYDSKFRNSPAYLQRDAFSVNGQGISGNMQLYQEENGDVSRNYSRYQTRDLGMVGLFTERREVQPWTEASRAVINKGIDILALLKKADADDDKDFDKTIFSENTLVDLRTSDRTFGKARFKMRGDMAGDYNLSSSSYNDYSANKYDLTYISGTGGSDRFSFLKEEKDMPMYYPRPLSQTSTNYNNPNKKLLNSARISHYKVGDLLTNYPAAKFTYNPETDSDCAAASKFKESFFNHHEYVKQGGETKGNPFTLVDGTNVKNMNILKHIKDLKTSAGNPGYFDSLIADIRVKNAEGLTYIYNLPVFCKGAKSLSLSGKGFTAPKANGTTDYTSFTSNGNPKDRDKSAVSEEYYYPYAWLLTSVVGSDYIDFDDIPGPSDGDLGYWVKFKYIKGADNYRWRAPFTGLEHLPGAIHDPKDDAYLASTGFKELYYVSEIESSEHTCKYFYAQRLDGMDAAGGVSFGDIYNQDAINSLNQKKSVTTDPTGTNWQFTCTKIQLYKKHAQGDNASQQAISAVRGKLLRETKFWYDYSTCPKTENNYARYNASIKENNVPYHIGTSSTKHAGTGKLTLRKVQHTSYEGATPVSLPSYQFTYKYDGAGAYEEMNPEYDYRQADMWGNYSKDARTKVVNTDAHIKFGPNSGDYSDTVKFYQNYTEIDKVQADRNAQAFKLSKVLLPGGGSMAVTFEANSYAMVQDQTPYVMRRVDKYLTEGVDGSLNKFITARIDITDLDRDGKDLSAVITPSDNTKNVTYGEFSFYESFSPSFPSREDQVYVSSGDVRITSITSNKYTINGRVYQEVVLKDKDAPTQRVPFVTDYKGYLYGSSTKMKAVKENLTSGCDLTTALAKYENLDKDAPLDALRKMVANVRNYFKSDGAFKTRFATCFEDPDAHRDRALFSYTSFIRTPVYKAKYTGSRVKSITFSDDFRYSTLGGGTMGKHENVYTTNYFNDALGNGTGTSAGVATIEPGGGASAVIDIYNKRGAGFFPSPFIVYSKSTMETGYNADPTNPADGDKISRKKGKTEYYFYTAADNDYKFENNFTADKKITQPGSPNGRFFMFGVWSVLLIKFKIFKKRIVIKVPMWVPLTVRWKRDDNYHLQSYSYLDQTDIFGRPKRVVYKNASNEEVSSQEFNYFTKDEGLMTYDGTGGPTVDPFTNASYQRVIKPGRMDQTWSEAYYTKESKIELIPWILFLNAHTTRNFSYTNMKYTYLPPVLKEVVNKNAIDQTKVTSTYSGFDYYTSQPLEIKNYDSYGNTKIQRVVPAYWKYSEMGPTTNTNPDNLNMLTQATGNYLYLGSVSNNNILSVGITEWSKSGWQFTSNVRPTGRNYVAPCTNFNYTYEVMDSDILEKLYNANSKTRASLPGGTLSKIIPTYVRDAKFQYKPFKSYAYETTTNADGTFTATNFNYTGAQTDVKWKLLSTVTKYNLYGNTVETKDILDKYAAAYFGYNFANSVTVVSNSTETAAAYSGAENTYVTPTGTMLDDHRIVLTDAEVFSDCSKAFADNTIVYNNFTSGGGAKVVTVCVPLNPTINKPFGKIDIVYAANTSIKRSFYVSLDENNEFRVISDRGEEFKGFYQIPGGTVAGCVSAFKLVFDPAIFQTFTVDNTFTNSEYSLSVATQTVPACGMPNKTYKTPSSNCVGMPHTGAYAFGLKGNGLGTRFDITLAQLPATENARKYKTMVWVHSSSPSGTTLVVEKTVSGSPTVVKSVSIQNPYLTIGDWKLLRTELDPSEYTGATKISFYMKNNSTGGLAIYDDFRVLPYQASMENYVYDHFTGRVTATLNGENIGTFYNYDSKGRLIEVKAEIENAGKQTIKKYLYNQQRNN